MFRYIAIVVTTLCALLCCISNAHAQGTLPRIGVRKWMIALPPQLLLNYSVAIAKKENKMFLGTLYGSIIVVDTRLGIIIDTIDLRSYSDVKDGPPTGGISGLQVTEDGKMIAVALSSYRRLLMISYPSKTLLDTTEMRLGSFYMLPQYIFLSPKGRYLVNDGALVDRNTGYVRKIPRLQTRVCFDTAETIVAYNVKGSVNGKECQNFINTWKLTDTTTVPESYDLVGGATLSADGTKLMSSGRTYSTDGKWASRPMAVVMNIADRTRLWQVSGDYSPDPGDFSTFAWQADATQYYGIRLSTSLPRDHQNRLFAYNSSQQDPVSILDDEELAGYSYIEAVFNTEMTEAYGITQNTVYAIDLSKQSVSVIDPTRHKLSGDTVYPNPTYGSVSIFYNSAQKPKSWLLIALNGQELQKGQLLDAEFQPDGRAKYVIEIPASIAAGTYWLLLIDIDGERIMSRVLVKL